MTTHFAIDQRVRHERTFVCALLVSHCYASTLGRYSWDDTLTATAPGYVELLQFTPSKQSACYSYPEAQSSCEGRSSPIQPTHDALYLEVDAAVVVLLS